ncbi:hypothetical protein CEUSTIGMA_g9170.t1 [Chlamydomonas eustigma]|uniref:Uncharacterized protein n=1 Tax=Chlamydomonas eustigma TaxID=1157962 RepID=A0A250XFQ5_9CHLO|nr:hypothetical protein CEUSTIGMA_g9170.t1 [Chlamydomonas eustigma]|eukprot:GAX81742.1 hypothetical protein CEUSTIGMA_g9170.t1 [Chlamydomonas eustigma]
MVSIQPYKTGPLDRIERGIRRSQGADGSARVDQKAPVVSTSQGVPRPPSPGQRTSGLVAVASARAGITTRTTRGSSRNSEPSLAGDPSSPTNSASLSVKSGDSSHYRTPNTSITTTITPPIPSVVGPSAGLNPNQGFDPDKRELTALVAQMIAESNQVITQNITQILTLYFYKRLQAQEFAVQASQAALEKKILEKVDRIEDDQAFFRGEVQAQKKSVNELHVSAGKVSTEVTRLAEQVKVQHELKEDISDQVTPKDLDDVWHRLDALQEAVFPDVSSQPPAPVDPQESLSFVPLHENPLQPTPWIENSIIYHPSSSSHSPAFHNALSGSPSSSSSSYQSSRVVWQHAS